jgi:outer membrane protein TolC
LEKVVRELKSQKFKAVRYRVRAAELELEAAEQRQRLWISSWLPTLSASYQYFPKHDDRDFSSSADAWKMGLQAEWTLFEGAKSFALRRSLAAQSALNRLELEGAAKGEKSEFRLWNLRGAEWEKKLENLTEAVKLADRAFANQERDYRLGLVTDLEVASAMQERINVRIDRAEILYQLGQHYVEAMRFGEKTK